MATIFQSFRSSTLSKRLLIYALRRLELLDEETLDMENLQFALGRTTTAEFKDVGVRLKKLERLLQLPASFQVQKAKVLKLNVTIPVDFYTSPIIIEIDGVDVRLKVSTLGDDKKTKAAARSDDAQGLPNTVNLAQSFLNEDAALKDAKLAEEKKRLEDALAAETQDLGGSTMSESSMSDDGSQFGTGQPLSLPGFLAGFLQGIVDRIQVRIRGVTFQMDVEVPLEPTSTTPELVTFQLALDRIDVEGVTAEAHNDEGAPTIVPKDGKRHIALSKIRAYLISEATVFSQFARSPSVSSPSISQSPSFSERTSASRHSTFRPTMQESFLSDSADLSEVDDALLQDSEEAFNIPYDFSSQPEEQAEEEEPTTPRASIYQDFSPQRHIPLSQSTIQGDEDEPVPWASFQREARSEPSLQSADNDMLNDVGYFAPTEALQQSVAASQSSSSGEVDDLAQSHVFTHEEAESMYMSAFSQAEPTGSRMPGGWDADSSPEASPKLKKLSPVPRQQTPPAFEAAPSIPESNPLDNMDAPASQRSQSPPPADQPDLRFEDAKEPLPASSTRERDEFEDAPAPADDVATPRGPTRLVKELVSLQNISLYVPSLHQHVHVPADAQASVLSQTPGSPGLARSVAPQLPGAFSVYSPPSASRSGFAPTPTDLHFTEPDDDRALEVLLSPLEIRFDASLAYLLAVVAGKLLDALKSKDSPAPALKTAAKPQQESTMPDINIVFEKISLHFLHQLGGVADTAERILGSPNLQMQPEILLRTELDKLNISLKSSKKGLETTVDLEKFRFGYARDDIISFDQNLQMRASVMDKFPSAGSDVTVKVVKSAISTRTEVTTLPLLIHLDLQRLDETFSWFGGLSSFLNMSSSMSSNASPSVRAPVQPPPKPRGVRFDAPINPDDKSASAENKIDMRIGGFNLELKGRECSVGLETSAVKMVSRDLGIGFAISKVRLAGPYIRNSRAEPPISAEIGGVRFEYLATPKDKDLERLLELIIPSKVKFDQGDDEIMVDTLLRQRRKGGVLRVTFDQLNVRVDRIHQLNCLPALGEEVARLATVAKYLPEDDRPGILLLAEVKELGAVIDLGGKLGMINANLKNFEVAQITVPSLVAFGIHAISVDRNHREELVSSSTTLPPGTLPQGPVLMVRMIGDEMEPVIKIKMRDITVDYRVPTIMDVLGLGEDATPQDFEASLAASVANLGEQAHSALTGKKPQPACVTDPARPNSKPMTVDLVFRDCLIGLNPLGLPSKLLIALTDARLQVVLPKDVDTTANLDLNKASILLIDDVTNIGASSTVNRRQSADMSSQQVSRLVSQGYVSICYISSAKAVVKVSESRDDGEKHVDVELRDDLLVLETCADSTQTLITLANALTPPTPPSKENKYRTSVVPVQDLLASISAEAFGRAEGDYDFDKDFELAQELGGSDEDDMSGDGSPLQIDSRYYEDAGPSEPLFDAEGSITSNATTTQDTHDGVLLTSFNASASHHSDDGSDLVIHENFFDKGPETDGRAQVWNSSKNSYDQAPKELVKKSPLRVSVRDVHVIWNLFDGYDWERTRDVISKAVRDVEDKAYERRRRSERAVFEDDAEEDETVIGDFLFNSIYIGISTKQDPRELAQMVNQELNDNATETESLATTAFTTTTGRTGAARPKKRLRLNRSKHHKITFELQGVNVDLIAFPPDSGETQSSIDVRIQTLDVFDHVPTSTWKKFATYDQDAGEREMGTSMAHLELLTVKPQPDLAASEMVLRVTLLPLRLHVDQDALDFITRFFEFKDDSAPVHSSTSDVPFLQRVEVHDIPVKLDFKPKRVDYAGLKSGRTTEFMNFIILDEARLTLRHTIIYGVSGFDRMGKILNDIWMPDVKGTQLAGVLAGLAPVRGIVNIGSGFKELIEVPIKEYKKDGRIVRSLGKGAAAFARTTGTEMVKFGAKLAIGTQYALQGAEGLLNKPQTDNTWEEADLDPEEKKQISLYADQPTGVIQGLRGGYSSLTRDLNMARDAIIAVPGEVMDSSSAQGLAKAVLKRAPTIIFRPAIGATKAIGQTLMGATNSLDPQNRRRAEEKYKRH
ncbi:ATG C terminal domain-containing protein [Colletotrichum abscissum]|uniref:Autophagy-related protein 2 n=1 Tax=Colletotrichum abscissum TaxID=1671311 RepID=A0A9P9X1V7_9PEZI|nr:ATG C terminal domain-containing protein [Colletotrichum abscissum]KAI3531500.1 ATG C terminal domain-containing protein [Colletotrichum abscissum]KAK1521887.1 ATG C terminal domain-containing protein [Colletotrichum abscissum]